MSSYLLLTGGTVLDPATETEGLFDVLICDDRIEGLFEPGALDPESLPQVTLRDVSGCYITPGLVDLHVHLREPGGEANETLLTGMKAAAAGGFTTICSMPNSPVTADTPEVVASILQKTRQVNLVEVLPIAALTQGLKGEHFNDLEGLLQAGAVAFSDDGMPIHDPKVMEEALRYSRLWQVPIIDHCEDLALKGPGLMHEGEISQKLGLPGISSVSEAVPIARNLLLAQSTGGHVHIAHLSTQEGVSLMAYAQAQGIRATAEAMPHHLRLTDEALSGRSTMAKVSPPLRSEIHREALVEAVKTGLISCLATDHAPWSEAAKAQSFEAAPSGISGLETAFAVTWDTLVVQEGMAPQDLIARWTIGPAQVLGLDRGRLEPGGPANLVVINPILKKTVDPTSFYSMGHNTPFAGMTLQGWPVMTIFQGKLVMENGRVAPSYKEAKP